MANQTVTTTYDLAGRLKTMEYPNAITMTYAYDDLGRVTAVNDGTNDRVADTYTGLMLQKRQYANGTYLTYLDDQGANLNGYGYDAFGRIMNHRWKDSNDNLLAGWHYDYDRLGNKKYQEDLANGTESELYGYDTVYRLDNFKRGQLNQNKTDIATPTRTQTWTLDPLGNWGETDVNSVAETRTHNTVNELTARTIGQNPQISLTYDAAGNLTQDGNSDGDHQYVWDYRNRLIEVKDRQSGNWNTVADYRYDAANRRALKIVTNKGALNGTTRFLWGGNSDWQCLEERSGNGSLVARYTYSPGYIDAVAVQERDLNADFDFGDVNEVAYYHSNTLFSVCALTNASESVVERYRYETHGTVMILDPDWSADADGLSDVASPYAFTGQRLDTEDGLMQCRQRSFSPTLGRFLARDPLGLVDQMDLYVYVRGRVTELTDPFGEYGKETHHDLTLQLARDAGLSQGCANDIANGDQSIDKFYPAIRAYWAEYWGVKYPGMDTRELVWAAILWHFPGADTGGVVHGSADSQWYLDTLRKKGDCSCWSFGNGLHPYQDSWAHEGVPPLGRLIPNAYGHAYKDFHWYLPWEWLPSTILTDADKPNARAPEFYNDMKASTTERLKEFLKRCPCNKGPAGAVFGAW